MTAQYAVWREVNGRESEYDPGPMDKKQAIKVASYQTSISIHHYFIKEVAFSAEEEKPAETPIGPVETRRAAHEMSMDDPRSNRERVVALLKAAGIRGMTCDEIEAIDGMQFTTAGAIIIDLRMEGWVVQSASELTRLTRRGSKAVVWYHLDYQIPEEERNVEKMGKGKWKAACEEAYALMLADGWEDAFTVLGVALGKETVSGD